MKPHDLVNSVKDSRVSQTAQSAHDAADKVYQLLVRADRPLEADSQKKPWLAVLWSMLLVGGGQLYNRQLAKALCLALLTYGVGGLLLAGWLLVHWLHGFAEPEGWGQATGQFFIRLGLAVPFVCGGLWLFAIVDAWRVAAALRRGELVVRYSFLKQTAYFAAGFIPVAGVLSPEETCAPDDVHKRLGSAVKDHVVERLVMRFLKRVLKIGFLVLGLLPLLLGAYLGWPVLVVCGAAVVLAGLIFLLH